MRDGWKVTLLGDLTQQVRREHRVTPGVQYRLLGVRWYGVGPFLREIGVGGEIKATRLFQTSRDDLIYNRLFAWKGSFGVIGKDLDGSYVSSEFPLFRVDETKATPAFINLIMCRPSVWSAIERQSTGSTTTSRNRWKEERFAEWEILLPPLEEQRRIVDLIGALDKVIEEAERMRTPCGDLASSIRESWLDAVQETTNLGSVISSIDAGKSPPAEKRQPTRGELAVLKVSAVRPGWFDPTEVKVIPSSSGFPEGSRLRNGDLLITRANTTELVGSVCRVDLAPDGYFLCDKTLRLNPIESRVTPNYLLEVLQSERVRRQIENAATGTSGSMKNISQESIRALTIPIAALPEQRTWASTLGVVRRFRAKTDTLLAELKSLRLALLDDLLSGEHEIPASYDQLLSV